MKRLAVLGSAVCAFAAAYILLTGALTYANGLGLLPSGRAQVWWQSRWARYTVLYAVLYSPAAAAALLATWGSRLSPRGASVLLGVYLTMICAVMQWTLRHGTGGGELLISELVGLSVVFLVVARICRKKLSART
jgi:hypothetical protein